MAAIQKIRSYGVVLICIVGLALFAFIAEELVRAISTTRNVGRQVIGEVYGESVNYQEFNDLYDEYENAVKMSNGGQNLTDVQTMQLRDQVWNDFVSQKAIEHEAKALGLQVTDAEVKQLISTGASPVLRQTPFVNQQTGAFDANMLQQFLTNYEEIVNNPDYPEAQKEGLQQLMKYWKFIEKQVRHQALVQKYQSLLTGCLISNPVSAKAAFEGRQTESTILLAAIPYTTIKDTEVQPTDEELKAKYNEVKKQFAEMVDMPQETRDIKYIAVPIKASEADEKALNAELTEYGQQMEDESLIANTVRESRSLVSYNGLAVSKKSLPTDIANELDSMAPGTQKGPFMIQSDNTLNLIKFISKTQLPDSVEFRRIDIAGTDDKAVKSADSILTALNAGAPMDSIAKKYNQAATAQWVTSAQVDNIQLSEENREFINTLLTTPKDTYKKIDATGGKIIIQVTDRRNMIDKYNVAVIKRSIDFSDETHNNVWNKFSSFLAANPTQADIEANATKNGYTVQESQYVSANDHFIANIHSTTDALRWVFDKAKKGDVSELYECGNNNDQLLVVMLTDVHKKGTRDMNEASLKSILEQEVIKDKKAVMLQDKIQGVKSVADVVKLTGAVQDTVSHITFAAPVFVQKVASSEPALSGAVASAKKGDFVRGVRGEAAVYAFQVLEQKKNEAKFDQKQEESQLASSYMRGMSGLMNVLVKKAKVEDNRYKFYQ